MGRRNGVGACRRDVLIVGDEKPYFYKLQNGTVGFRAKSIRRAVSLPSRSFCYALISPSQRGWRYRARAWEEVVITTVCPTRIKVLPPRALMGADTQATLCWRWTQEWGKRWVWSGHRAEESVNEGTAQVEKVPPGSFLEGGPSCIIFLTPLQEGLMTLSKDAGLVEEEGGGVGMTYREEAPQMPQRR